MVKLCQQCWRLLGRKDVLQGSMRKVCKINFEKSKNEKSKSGKVSFWILKSRKVKNQKVEKWKGFVWISKIVEKSKNKKSKSEKVSISKSRKVRTGMKGLFFISKNRKVYFLTFHFLTVWIFAGCPSSRTCASSFLQLREIGPCHFLSFQEK